MVPDHAAAADDDEEDDAKLYEMKCSKHFSFDIYIFVFSLILQFLFDSMIGLQNSQRWI